ncbi:eukaryotic aspartyl protease [Apiospora saccharicola]
MWYASLLLSANWSVTAQLTSKRKQPTSQPGISCQSLKASCTPVTSATVPCKRAAAKDAQFTFQFLGPEGAQITVPLRDYFVPIRYAPGLPRTGPDYDVSQHGDCEFKMTIKQGDILTLGKPFMRNAYTVYDQENHVFGLAQSSYSTDNDIVLFAKRGEPIPLSVPGPVVRPSGPAYNSNQTDLLDFPVAASTTLTAAAGKRSPIDSPNESSTAIHSGIGVGIPLGVLLLGVAALEVWIWVLKRPLRLCGHTFFWQRQQLPQRGDRAGGNNW